MLNALSSSPADLVTLGADDGMSFAAGGTFRMGSEKHYPEEAPVHRVSVDGFWIDRTRATNHDFRKFVNATGYVTLAQRQATNQLNLQDATAQANSLAAQLDAAKAREISALCLRDAPDARAA